MAGYRYDEKNQEDYKEVTERIERALQQIASDKETRPTKANLARISGVHRNTLYKRALGSCIDGEIESGWPLVILKKIASSRLERKAEHEAKSANAPALHERTLRERLEKSRFEVSMWFQKYIVVKAERDEAHRQVELASSKIKLLEQDIRDLAARLRKEVRQAK